MSQKYIKNVKKINHKNNSDIGMHCCQNSDKLFIYFAKYFDSEKFFEIFFWTESIIDYEKLKAMIYQVYVRIKDKYKIMSITNLDLEIYINLAVQIKLHDNLMKKSDYKKEAIGA
ncbi:LOW QUALITY PROTEIN: hypothetical protein CIHG_10384 [Coccidioides immitis H538.4]|uniref:Uncharacterized protein n=1 Tax=Coccidioides immitis H538.4 TaxID=396776 RepID=A0A0J8S881_COCIT|nr:LOW QUALITY PROTEIN: hypothetical protein CIHG_10384 [Coccidioides immitis H538.4]